MQVFDPQFPERRRVCLVYAGLALVTLALYLPALHNGFVEYDDQQYVTDNPHVQAGLTWAGFIWAFGFHAGNWHPLAWLSHMLDCQLFGARAWGHHLTSILLHTSTTLLLFAVLRRMTGRLWPSAAVAALFAWHPLHVESVAWVAERKDVLCAFFWMATLWCYTGYAEKSWEKEPRLSSWNCERSDFGKGSTTSPQPSPPLRGGEGAGGVRSKKGFYRVECPAAAHYLFTLAAFALCLMAKPMAVTLPFVLLLLDFWPLTRVAGDGRQVTRLRQLIVEKIPFLLLAGLGCALTLHAQQIAIVSTAGLTLSQRFVHTLVAYNHYFWAMFFPCDLAVYYPYVLDLNTGTIVFSGLVLLLVTALALKNFRARPWLIVGWLWFLGTLVPVIGLVQVGDQAWADRYTYLPLVGLFIPLVWLAAEMVKNKTALRTLTVAAGLAMLVTTSLQLSYWKNTWSLFDHANKVTRENYMAVTVLASQLAKQGKLDEAMDLYHTALRYKPTFPETHFFLGNAFDQLGRPDDAVAEYEKALWFKPMQEQTHIFLGIVLGKQKKYDAAITNYEAALKIDPDSAVTHNNLARIYHTQGRFDEAIAHYDAALKIDPKLALAHNNLGILLLQRGSLADGTFQLREALHLNPTNSETQFNLALALNQQQQWPEAAQLFAKTVAPGSTDPKAHFAYAAALAHTQKTREAMGEYAAALLLQPDYPDALDGLAWILSTDADAADRNGTQAVPMAERACELTGRKDAEKLKTLAAAYAEVGRFSEANATAQEAQSVATQAGQKELAQTCQAMQENFKSSKPWR